jgi:NAD(P)-dependent dehydrogenase (short-subunit alcohol dehydrogenase family)
LAHHICLTVFSPQAAGGIGREVSYTFAEAGVKGILLADIDSKGAAEAAETSKTLASRPDYRCLSTSVDVVDVASVDAMVKLAVETFGRIDYCVNAFGVSLSPSAQYIL